MVSAEEAAAAKVQSMKRGNDARNQVKEGKAARKVQAMQRGKKSRKGGDALVHVIETGNFARFEKLMESGAEATPAALRAALKSPVRAFGSMLVSNQATWGVDHKMLEVWNRVQKALYPPPPETRGDVSALTAGSRCDNVVLEHAMVLELAERNLIERVVPVLMDSGASADKAADVGVRANDEKLANHLAREGLARVREAELHAPRRHRAADALDPRDVRGAEHARRRVRLLHEPVLPPGEEGLRRVRVAEDLGRKRVRNSQLWRLISRSITTRFG